uniref:FAM86 N-terminal domain-containing protein n=1 Tax=Setaria digitata TaxID=48799 RepID=A0A915Q2W6_9BILA
MKEDFSILDDRNSIDGYVCFRKGHPCELSPLLPKAVAQFVREYFASATVSHVLLNKIVLFCEDSSQQQLLGDILCGLETRHAEIGWQLYRCLTDSMIDTVRVDRIYFDDFFSNDFLQASCDLANYLLKYGRDYISDNNILELGAGCGLLGIALAASGIVKSVTLSDGNNDVLDVIRHNIRANFSEDCDTMVNVIFVEWGSVNIKFIPVVPDVILATDVVYDTLAVEPLVSAIKKLLVSFNKEKGTSPCCIIANTIRNQNTVDKFITYAGVNLNGNRIEEDLE